VSADDTYRTVMQTEPPANESPYAAARRSFVFGDVWTRPGLSIRERRFVALACVCAADAVSEIDAHIYAALKSGDLTLEQMNEFTLHFAVYCGWPKASQVEMSIRAQWQKMHDERGEPAPAWPTRSVDDLGFVDPQERIDAGVRAFEEVNLIAAPSQDSPYFYAGILNFVFGHMWQRPGLTRRDRRLITLPCVGVSDAMGPIYSHVGSAMGSGDLSYDEVQELILQFSAYAGFAKGQVLHEVAAQLHEPSP
jgi:4-carboxymuconolactone decarboxylase